MPVATRKTGPETPTSTRQGHQTGIQRFAKVTKDIKHATDSHKVSELSAAATATIDGPNLQVTKRKRDSDDGPASADVKRSKIIDPPSITPRKSRANPQFLPTPDTTPTKPTKWATVDTVEKSLLQSSKLHLDTPPASPTRQRPFTTLPHELYDLLRLNAALLQALSLQFAHLGSVAPIDVRLLRPSVTRIWGKRKTTLDDIRHCLAILHQSSTGQVFHLYDYERGRICIERSAEHDSSAVIARHVDEDRLNEQFEHTLIDMWETFQKDSTNGSATEVKAFVAGLPLEPIVLCPSLNKIKPRLLAGQRRLEDLKGISLERRTAEKVSATAISQAARARKAAGISDRSQSLLARLRAKEDYAAAQPTPATKEQMQRKSALSRLHEIVPILAAPKSKTNQRTTFALPMLVQTIQGSARNAMAKDEAVHSLELLCELAWGGAAGTFVEMVPTGGVTAVVVDPTRRPADWKARLDTAVDEA